MTPWYTCGSFDPASLQHDILLCAEHLDSLEGEFRTQMDLLKETVQSKTAVPTAQVYVSYTYWESR